MKPTNLNILFFSTFPPRECGIATFTRDLSMAIAEADKTVFRQHIAISDIKGGYNYPPDHLVPFEINQFCLEDYERAAEYVNNSGADVISIQHEFGIFGGFDGVFLTRFLEKVKIPKVITWHTMPMTATAERKDRRLPLLKKLASLCDANVNLTRACQRFVIKQKISSAQKAFYIPHGAPFFDLSKISQCKEKLGLKDKIVLGTQGMVSENKGLHYALLALPEIIKRHKNVIYLIIGTSHPRVPRAYYEYLKSLTAELKLENNVRFIDRYLTLSEVIEYLSAVDIHLNPYLTPEQVSSGVLCYSVAAGNYNIATPFSYAKEVLAQNRGVIVPFRNPKAISEAVLEAIREPAKRQIVQQRAYEYGRQFLWENVATKYLSLFLKLANDFRPELFRQNRKARAKNRLTQVMRLRFENQPLHNKYKAGS